MIKVVYVLTYALYVNGWLHLENQTYFDTEAACMQALHTTKDTIKDIWNEDLLYAEPFPTNMVYYEKWTSYESPHRKDTTTVNMECKSKEMR